ncbi:MAG: metallophosphoesterase family protein [Thermoleophilaceae bacterium]|nr:metallophosphoesterase family protein [Thermoleophilaceae bacterium]
MLALLYDIHGNLPSLEAVLDDAQGAGADRFLLGGDYAAFGAWPAETVELLRTLDARWLRGNVDRWTLDSAEAPEPARPALNRCRELLGDETAIELAALPASLSEGEDLYVHGSPVSDVRSFMPDPHADDEELIADARPRRLVFGHTHVSFARTGPHGVELLNPGSVGMPFDGDHRAAYALVREDGTVEPRRVAYDHAASAAAVRDVLGEAGELPARRIERARFDAA